MNYVLGIDLGTSGVKTLLVNTDGEIISTTSVNYTPDFLDDGYVEQDPSIWWEATQQAIIDLVSKNPEAKGNILALSCSGQMHSSVFLDNSHNVIRKAILWNDTRTTPQTHTIYDTVGKENLLSMSYNLALEGFTLPKIIWLRDNEPDNFNKVHKVIMPKDYINYKLTGNIYTDVSDAAGTLLFDVKNSKWSLELCQKLSLNPNILPDVLQSTGLVGTVTDSLADTLGLAQGCKVIAGGADNSCAAVGNGVIKKGQAVVSVGTSGTVIAYLDDITSDVDGSVHLFNYSAPNSMYAMGCMLCAGEALNWLQRTLFDSCSFRQLDEFAAQSPAGSNKLIFLPYLFGERTPHNDPKARGVFFGINSATDKGDIIRSVMEGVAFGLKDMYQNVSAFTDIDDIYITGGGAKSPLWGQIIADILNKPLKVLNISEGPSFGAALLAMVGAGICDSLETAKGNSVNVERTITPSPNAKNYEHYYDIYRKLYIANKTIFAEL